MEKVNQGDNWYRNPMDAGSRLYVPVSAVFNRLDMGTNAKLFIVVV